MTRPLLEVADIVRSQGDRFIHSNFRWIHWAHRKVLRAIARCRTASLGGHRDKCPRCGYRAISFNSCRDRHCPKCQSGARDKWITARQSVLLPVAYVHVVFTLPHQLSPLALQNKKVLYDLLFRASAETLLEVARDPRHLGAGVSPGTVQSQSRLATFTPTAMSRLGGHNSGHSEQMLSDGQSSTKLVND